VNSQSRFTLFLLAVVHDSLVVYGATEMCFDILIGGLIDGLVVGWLVDL